MERLQEIATRKAEIKALLESEEEVNVEELRKEIEALEVEEKAINDKVEEETRKAKEEAEQRKADADRLNKGEVKGTEMKKEEKKMEIKEFRNTPEYIDVFERYVRTGDETEIRSLLTTNVGDGTIAVPDFVEDEIKTAWENEQIMSLVHRAELKGNYKINFEISSTGAVKHLEGSEAVAEETLVEGVATIVPASFKKWISISDEAYDMRGEPFLRYIYREISHKIAKAVANELVGIITNLPENATATTPNADAVTKAPAQDTIATAFAHLSDEASNPVIIMNKLTYATFKGIQYGGNYGVDIFEGLKVVFNSTLPAYDSADANDVYLIVGDLGYGAVANFPNGNETTFKFDELSRKKEDLIEVLGRQYVGVGAVAPKAFTLVKKPSASI